MYIYDTSNKNLNSHNMISNKYIYIFNHIYTYIYICI